MIILIGILYYVLELSKMVSHAPKGKQMSTFVRERLTIKVISSITDITMINKLKNEQLEPLTKIGGGGGWVK